MENFNSKFSFFAVGSEKYYWSQYYFREKILTIDVAMIFMKCPDFNDFALYFQYILLKRKKRVSEKMLKQKCKVESLNLFTCKK